jgi:LPS sulfotransferase NodH
MGKTDTETEQARNFGGRMNLARVQRFREEYQQKYGDLALPKKSYIICSTARSGSNYLSWSLQNAKLGLPHETFNKGMKLWERWGVDKKFETFIPEVLIRQTNPETNVFGMKLFWYHLSNFKQWALEVPEIKETNLSDYELLEVFFPNVQFIFLQRRDKLMQAVSYAKMMQSGVSFVREGERGDSLREEDYDRGLIENLFDQLIAYDLLWEDFFSAQTIEPVVIYYEDLIAEYLFTIEKIFEKLGLPMGEFDRPKIEKQRNQISYLWYERFSNEVAWVKNPIIQVNLEEMNYLPVLSRRLLDRAQIKKKALKVNRRLQVPIVSQLRRRKVTIPKVISRLRREINRIKIRLKKS